MVEPTTASAEREIRSGETTPFRSNHDGGTPAPPGGTSDPVVDLRDDHHVASAHPADRTIGAGAGVDPTNPTVEPVEPSPSERNDPDPIPAEPTVAEPSMPDPFALVRSPDVGEQCADGLDAASLTAFFARPISAPIGDLQGADYQRVFKLPDGRVLWTFQDGFVSGTLVHNVGMVQSGRCFTMLNTDHRSWLLADQTSHISQWHWILDGAPSADGSEFHLYVAQMTARTGNYIDGKVDVTGLNRVVLDADSLEVKTVIPETCHETNLARPRRW